MPEWMDMRVFYRKLGRMRYLSHLDVNRFMQRSFARAGLPVWYTQGFHPHLYLTFALPLSLGYESEYECMDFRLTQPLSQEELLERLNGAMVKDLQAFAAKAPVRETSEIASADYRIQMEALKDEETLLVRWRELLEQPAILADKKTKKGIKEVDLKPTLRLYRLQCQNGSVYLEVGLPAGQTMHNPSLLLSAFDRTYAGLIRCTQVTRTAIRCADGSLFC